MKNALGGDSSRGCLARRNMGGKSGCRRFAGVCSGFAGRVRGQRLLQFWILRDLHGNTPAELLARSLPSPSAARRPMPSIPTLLNTMIPASFTPIPDEAAASPSMISDPSCETELDASQDPDLLPPCPFCRRKDLLEIIYWSTERPDGSEYMGHAVRCNRCDAIASLPAWLRLQVSTRQPDQEESP